MGVVYQAKDTKLDRTVGLKFLPSHLTQSEKDKQRFLREAKAVASLNHPNICTIHSIEEHNGRPFFVMECIDGQTLSDLFNTRSLSTERTLQYAIQISKALAEAHEKGIVHRDIKPSNIMVDSKNRIKVMDFGLAKLSDSKPITQTGTTVGTMAYMAPEQIQGRPVDHRADLFSFGVLLFEMLTGTRPFRGEYDAALTYAIVNEEPPLLSDLLLNVPQKLTMLIKSLLIKDPAKRYSSTENLAIDLEICLKELSNSLEPVSRQNNNKSNLPSVEKSETDESSRSGSSTITINLPPLKSPAAVAGIGGFLIILSMIGYWLFSSADSHAFSSDNSIAVLPLESISQNPDDMQFTDGIHEELINRLAGISDLMVIARRSVLGFSPGNRDLQSIGRELGVSSIIDGTVRRAGDRLRVTVQLIDVNSLGTIWSGSFDEDIDDVFEIQSRIAEQVAGQLQASLTIEEQERLSRRPTDNPLAYRFYMQGREYLSRPAFEEENMRLAEQFFTRSVEEDPKFTQAWAMLAYTYSSIYWFHGKTPEQLERVKKTVEQAHFLDPYLPETQLAMGAYLFRSNADFDDTLSYFEMALQRFPNEPNLHLFTALTHRRLGNWDLLIKHLKRAVELDPLNTNINIELAYNYWMVRDYDRALLTLDHLLEFNPNESIAYFYKAWFGLSKDGSLEGFENWWNHISPADPAVVEPGNWGDYNSLKRNWDEALRGYENLKDPIVWQSEVQYKTKEYLMAITLQKMGDSTKALNHFEKIRTELESLKAEHPNEPRYRMELGKVYARIGESEKAIQEAQKAEELLQPLFLDAEFKPYIEMHLAYIYTWSGELELALDKLESSLSGPSSVHRNDIRMDPTWDPLRDLPRFQELMAEEDKAFI